MPTTRQQKKVGKSRGAEMLSDIENLGFMLGGNHSENLAIPLGDLIVQISMHQKMSRRTVTLILGKIDQVTVPITDSGTDSSAEFNRLSAELNLGISRETDEVMNSVSVQIQRAINDAIRHRVLPQIQNALRGGSRKDRTTRSGDRNVMPKITQTRKSGAVQGVPFRNRLYDENTDSTHDHV